MSIVPVRVLTYGIVMLAVSLAGVVVAASTPAGAAATSPANGQGSTYAALAFQQWTQTVQNQGLNLNYTPTSSPAGLEAYSQNTADFAGTEAEFSELLPGSPVNVPRGFEYTPDVAGASAVMYNVALTPSGQDPVSSLRLAPMTIAKIFLGKINNWNDPAISADNGGVTLPNQHITVVCRTGQSGTTALFYDFVAHTDPTDYASWAVENGFSTGTRILEVDNAISPTNMACQSGSDTEANFIAANRWTIGYDEFGYAKVYNDNVAWVQNASGNWVQPYAVNIERGAAVGAAGAGHLAGSDRGLHQPQRLGVPDIRLLLHLGAVRTELGAHYLHHALYQSRHREHAGPIHEFCGLRGPGPYGRNRLRTTSSATVAVPS